MARLTTCLAILVVISVILQQQPVTGFSRPFRSFLKAQSRDLDEDQDEAHDVADEEMADRGLTCRVAKLNKPIWCDHSGVCDDCKPYVLVAYPVGFSAHCGIGCDEKGWHCERCRKRGD